MKDSIFNDQAVPHVVYDLSLPLEERREKAQVFKSAAAAANWLGMPPNKLFDIRIPGRRAYKNGKAYAVRIAPKDRP